MPSISRSRSSSSSRSYSRTRSRSYSRDFRSNRKNYRDDDNEKPRPNKCLGVFNLDTAIDERELKHLFGRDKFGDIEDIHIIKDHINERSKGYGFITFRTIKQAERARNAMTGLLVNGKSIRVDFSRTASSHSHRPGGYRGSRQPIDPEPNRCLGIFNLHQSTNEKKLYDKFRYFGSIETAKVIYNHHTNEHRGFGFVYYKKTSDAVEAKRAMNNTVIAGKTIKVDFSTGNAERERSPRYRKRSLSNGRSHKRYDCKSPIGKYRSKGRY
ncbi:MAG: transformer 2 beta [Paramarteilia canceri]